MARIKLIHHINVQIGDRARTREWYEKVLGAEFLDRGPALNKRQMQLRLGNGEIHFTETSRPTTIASGHFALEVDDWEAMLSRLDAIGVKHVRTSVLTLNEDAFRALDFGADDFDLPIEDEVTQKAGATIDLDLEALLAVPRSLGYEIEYRHAERPSAVA